MKVSAFLLPTSFIVLAFAPVSMAMGQKRLSSSAVAREWLDSLTAEATQATSTGKVQDKAGTVLGLPATSVATPERRVTENGWQNSAPQMQPDLRATASGADPGRKLSRREKAKAIWQVAAGLLGLPADVQNTQYPQRVAQHSGQSVWQGTSTQEAGYSPARQVYNNIPTPQSYDYAPPIHLAGYPGSSAVAFRRVQSADGIMSIQLPADWQLRPALGQNYSAVSPRGESFSCGKLDVFMDAASMKAAAQALRMKGASQQELAFLPRLVSHPLSPEQIVLRLLPQVAGGAMQNVEIIGGQRLPDGSIRIAYRYLLLPKRDSLSRSLLPPALMRETQVLMQAEIYLQSAPGIPVGLVRTWSFFYSGISAPQSIYPRNVSAYAAIFRSISVNGRAVQDSMAQDQQLTDSLISGMEEQNRTVRDLARRTTDRQIGQINDSTQWKYKMDDKIIRGAGGQVGYSTPSGWEGTSKIEEIPIGAQYSTYYCPAESNNPIHADHLPYVDCELATEK